MSVAQTFEKNSLMVDPLDAVFSVLEEEILKSWITTQCAILNNCRVDF